MTTTNTFGIVFYLKRQKEKNGKAPIYARITVDGKRVEVSIKKDIDVDNWNKGKVAGELYICERLFFVLKNKDRAKKQNEN